MKFIYFIIIFIKDERQSVFDILNIERLLDIYLDAL